MLIKPIQITVNGNPHIVYDRWVNAQELFTMSGLKGLYQPTFDNLKMWEFDIQNQRDADLKLTSDKKTGRQNAVVTFNLRHYRAKA